MQFNSIFGPVCMPKLRAESVGLNWVKSQYKLGHVTLYLAPSMLMMISIGMGPIS